MTPYFSRTGTKRNLAAASAAGWGILVSAAGVWRDEGFCLIGADNGQWAERDNPLPFKTERFERFLAWLGDRAVWLAVPDVPFRGLESWALTLEWLPKLRGHPSVLLIVVQNGMTPAMVAPFVGPRVGIFVGGDDAWKEESLPGWGQLAREAGCYLHVGRVNSARRIFLCAAETADSFDGTSVTNYASTLPMLDQARQHQDLAARWRDAPTNLTPAGFARHCREIVANLRGHEAHRALDAASNEVLRSLGYGDGIDIFEQGVRGWHSSAAPYPSQACGHSWIDHERARAGLPLIRGAVA